MQIRWGQAIARYSVAAVVGFATLPVLAQGRATAQLVPAESHVEDWGRGIEVALALSGPVPWRAFTLDDPRRLVLELRTVEWDGADVVDLLQGENATALRAERAQEGWSRLVLTLGRPLEVTEAGMTVREADGSARLHLLLEATDEESFAAAAGAPPGQDQSSLAAQPAPTAQPADSKFVVAIDPGHGGIDPGAEREGLREAEVMLSLGQELASALERAGMDAVLTRSEDIFVPLQERMTIARASGADVLISLHADALEGDDASGASIYTLTAEAVSQASGKMVERHGSGDLLAGLDLRGQDDRVATALMDLVRLDTAPRSQRLASTLAAELVRAGAAVNTHPLRQAPLAVLNAADFPSVLIEAGFLSDPGDRSRLSSAAGRAPVVAGIVAALGAWKAEDQERATLLRR